MTEAFRPFEVANYLKTEADVIAYGDAVRESTIEECAKVADDHGSFILAKAIRALKGSKP